MFWVIVGSMVVIILGNYALGYLSEGVAIASALLGLITGFGIWAFLKWVRVPPTPSRIIGLASAVIVFIWTWFKCRSATEACIGRLENALFFIPLGVVFLGVLILYFTNHRPPHTGDGAEP